MFEIVHYIGYANPATPRPFTPTFSRRPPRRASGRVSMAAGIMVWTYN